MRIAPIDIDFAGWSEVPEDEANAWGVFNDDNVLVVARKTKDAAEARRVEIERGNP